MTGGVDPRRCRSHFVQLAIFCCFVQERSVARRGRPAAVAAPDRPGLSRRSLLGERVQGHACACVGLCGLACGCACWNVCCAAHIDGGGNSRQSSSSSGVATRRKPQKNVAADKTRFAPARIGAPRQAASPPSSPPRAQHCWLRCRSSTGDPPQPGGSKGVRRSAIIAAVRTGVQHRQPNSQSILLRMTGKMTGKCSTAGDFVQVFPLIREIDPSLRILTSLLNHRHSQSTWYRYKILFE